jgi:hypothetical protein
MTLDEILEKKIERVRLPSWNLDTYLKLDYAPDGQHSPWVYFVSPRMQHMFTIKIGAQKLPIEDLEGREDWEPYKGIPYWEF